MFALIGVHNHSQSQLHIAFTPDGYFLLRTVHICVYLSRKFNIYLFKFYGKNLNLH